MIGIDTNVIVRYIVADDDAQTRRAVAFVDSQVTPENPGFISVAVLAELVWVLERSYRLSAVEINETIELLLCADALVIANEPEVVSAMNEVWEGRGVFTDALIGALNTSAGCSQTVTFDLKATRMSAFKVL